MKVAIVGCGAIAEEKHIPAFRRLGKKVRIVAVCDKNEDLAKQIATRCGIPAAFTEVSDMLASCRIDAIDICTPPRTHRDIALTCIDDGCHIIMEKPMALSVAECDQIIASATKRGSKLCVIHNDLFHPPFVEATRLVEKGTIGDLRGLRILLSTPHWDMIDLKDHWYHKLPGGVIGETSPHLAYMTAKFLKEVRVIDVFAMSRMQLPWAPLDEFRIEMEGSNGFCSGLVTYNRGSWDALVEIIGTRGSLMVDLERMSLVHRKLDNLNYTTVAISSLTEIAQMSGNLLGNVIKTAIGRERIGTEAIIAGFVDSLLYNHEPPVTGDDGREATRIVEMIVNRIQRNYES